MHVPWQTVPQTMPGVHLATWARTRRCTSQPGLSLCRWQTDDAQTGRWATANPQPTHTNTVHPEYIIIRAHNSACLTQCRSRTCQDHPQGHAHACGAGANGVPCIWDTCLATCVHPIWCVQLPMAWSTHYWSGFDNRRSACRLCRLDTAGDNDESTLFDARACRPMDTSLACVVVRGVHCECTLQSISRHR
jgi:hypothetical protein